jgi:hypothetical protein
MAKSYPVIDIKCNECGSEVKYKIPYESDLDRWTRAGRRDTTIFIPPQYRGWTIRGGNTGTDLCPKCTKEFDSTD